ncbi:unnamed protein product [Parnassius apollo]|uniref:(apollo) hypothetical protein n=1 Tax=Parnassius apollo TaxID=110799 RepID=A0A8S3WMU2_PARAO|nr:unnamed protein product [Parnassius apollo]
MKSGASADSIYEPTLWYYSDVNFLHDQEVACDSESSMDITQNSNTQNSVEDDVEQNTVSQTCILNDNDCKNDNDSTAPGKILKKHASTKAKNEVKLMNLAYEHLSERKKDEYTYWALACAADLRKRDRPQQIYAKKRLLKS